MQLKELLSKVPTVITVGPTDRDVTGICYDSRRVKKGSIFVALKGEKEDGNQFIDSAIERGAVAIVCEEEHPAAGKATQVIVSNARQSLADLAAVFYGRPSLPLKTIGITGTNGKTTTAFLVKHLCEAALMRCGLIGTVQYEIGDRILPALHTTPESVDLQELLYQIRSAGCRAAVMEVSSHAISQQRIRNTEFDVAVFTNLTQDHLDYHRTMAYYFDSKAALFTGLAEQKKKKGLPVINVDDVWGQKLITRITNAGGKVITYGMGARADFRASNVKSDLSGSQYQLEALGKTFLVRLPLIGSFNIYNSLAALTAVAQLGVDLRTAVKALATAPAVPGRLEPVPVKRKFRVFVDYAHTEDALSNVLRTLRDLKPRRLIAVFGCGGNRDRAKRPNMASTVESHADWAIVTSDNPRKEDPEAIIEEVKAGFRRKSYETIPDRREAIYRAISLAEAGDIVLIAGKGHETYQEFADHTIPFDDLAVARLAVEARPVDLE